MTSGDILLGGHQDRPGAVALSVRDLSVGYGRVACVHDVSFDLRRGEILALLGANGAGKTTTLLGVAGVLKPMGGQVSFESRTVTSPLYVRARQGLALLTQERCVFMGLTLRDNLRVGGCDEEIALEYFPELKSHLRRRVGLLSGGQQQMLAVGRAIARSPRVLLADELSLGLAPQIVDRILDTLVRACRDQGLAVVMVEQQVHKCLPIADRCIVLQRGRLALTGSAVEVRDDPDLIRNLYLGRDVESDS